MSAESKVPAAVHSIVNLVRGTPGGLTYAELAVAVRARHARAPDAVLAKHLRKAVAAGLLQERDGRFKAPALLAGTDAAPTGPAAGRCLLRAVALDVESVVRTVAREPFAERHVYQAAAVRFGPDGEWVGQAPCWDRYARPACDIAEIRDVAARERVRKEGTEPARLWHELAAYVTDADVVVAYNGTGLDFPVIKEAAAAAGCDDPLAGRFLVDALYLAHAVWPQATSHGLHALSAQQNIPLSDLRAHTAPDDAELLVRLLYRAAEERGRWPSDLARLVDSVCVDSPAWRLLRALGQDAAYTPPQEGQTWEQHEVADVLRGALAGHPYRRRPAGQRTRRPVVVPDTLRGVDGRVDPGALAALVHGADAEPRPAQQDMAVALHTWTAQGTPALLEAPTGTGKSFAVLAAALEWLAGDPRRTAVIATFTKQLQTQLAADVRALENALPGILGVTDLVKGQSNRLSLAALTALLAEGTEQLTGHETNGPGAHTRFVTRRCFRELAVYLLLRLRGCPHAPQSWTARSVDPVDLPAFFADYAGGPLALWLAAISQRDGDYQRGSGASLAAHTDTTGEAIAGHRLVLANHALAVSHLDDLRALGPETLIVVDEAHELENAATSALTAAADYRDLEDLLAECGTWSSTEARAGAARDRVRSAVAELATFLQDERLPRLAARFFDGSARGVGVRVGSRSAVLASPYAGMSGTRDARRMQRLLTVLSRAVSGLGETLAGYGAERASGPEALGRGRAAALARRADDMTTALDRVTTDLDTLLSPEPPLPVDRSPARPGHEPGAGAGPPSRVVYLEELAEPEPGLRSYQFRIASSPVELPADPEWRRYLESFPRVHYVSATLRVAGEWTFVRERLGLADTVPALALASPFDLARQSELVCFDDFPSWAEQEEGAMCTLSHQLAGYAAEMTRPRPDGNGFDGGALVLTTARATAAGITGRLEQELRARAHAAPVVGALAVGNGRAFAEFTEAENGGGFLVGTKGLWQGVDVADEDRLRLVWINKLPFAPFADPLIEARRAAVRDRAEEAGHPDPDGAATETYYLPLAALQLHQAVGRLIRSSRHRGVIVISDRKLGGYTELRRAYRRAFLGSLDPDLLRTDPDTGEAGGGNVTTMTDGWRRIWTFLAREGLLPQGRAKALCEDEALERHTLLPHTRRIRELALGDEEIEQLRARGRFNQTVLERTARVAGLLNRSDQPVSLKPAQRTAISAVAEGRNVLGLLPTGYGKSYTFQLPALVLPGVTLVISPLVALMHDQALELNRSIGGAVRALISPLRESSSRAGKTEVADQLLARRDHGIRLVYVSPERLCQRRFRELLRHAVGAGTVRRIAVDEAHTMAQWEDFRPSMRRVGRFLAELRRIYGLPVTAVTATANQSVHSALREGLFGLGPESPRPGTAEHRAENNRVDVRGGLVTVQENPVRADLAVFRRALPARQQRGAVGLAERVVDALEGHAIFYCLTVKEVNALHAHLREYTGETGVRVRRFHGRLTEAEKAAVMTEFREAAPAGEEEFTPLVTVATSAFGLGINRSDIRTVFCVSPPTDLAALYQQIGRAGRDGTWHSDPEGAPANTALALATGRGLRTAAFMAGQDLPAALLRRMGRAVLAVRGSLDAGELARTLLEEDATSGHLSEEELKDAYTADRYRSGIMRAFSALADLGAVTDLGDYPPLCAVREGQVRNVPAKAPEGDEPADETAGAERVIVRTALAMPGSNVSVDALHEALAGAIDTYRDLADGPAGTWEILADLHDRGLLDVSAAPSRQLRTGLVTHQRQLPEDFLRLLTRRSSRAAAELTLLRNFFEDTTTCAQRLYADYFGVADVPEGSCAQARCRCSACWSRGDWPAKERRPPVAQAFESASPVTGGAVDGAVRAMRLDAQVYRLCRAMPQGVHPRALWRALRGEEASYHPVQRRLVPLQRALRESPDFGGRADLPYTEVEESQQRLLTSGAITVTGDGRWHAVRRADAATPSLARRRKGSPG